MQYFAVLSIFAIIAVIGSVPSRQYHFLVPLQEKELPVREWSMSLVERQDLCPDYQSVCPDEKTCCRLLSGQWGCCPLPNAVCCSHGNYCCPEGHTCVVSVGCTK